MTKILILRSDEVLYDSLGAFEVLRIGDRATFLFFLSSEAEQSEITVTLQCSMIAAANAYLFPASGTTPMGPTSPMGGMGIGIDMDDPDDPERFRRGSPWTPAVVHTGSYAFGAPGEAASSPLLFAAPASSPFGHDKDRDDEDDDDDGACKPSPAEAARTRHAKAAYIALVRVSRWKAVVGRTLDRDHVGVYRRDVGDTMVNAYYVLRDYLLVYLVDEAARGGAWAWETIEAPLFLLRCVYEAVDFSAMSTATPCEDGATAALARLFGAGAAGGDNGNGNGKDDAEREAVAQQRRTALGLVVFQKCATSEMMKT
ncbi:hypothetical protein K438DRAFT_2075968 [Mycena galopus ATCC 62051]|nr:hypothetical protein K438DRAFT_2075968 [Mycena galopus ATCC 62051]